MTFVFLEGVSTLNFWLSILFLVSRDTTERGREVVEALVQYNRFVKPAYDEFIKPSMKHANIVVPLKEYNENAVEMLVSNLKIKMRMLEQEEDECPDTPISIAVRSEMLRNQNNKLALPDTRK